MLPRKIVNTLEIRRRLSRIYECGGDTWVIDFLIDGVAVIDRVQKSAPHLFTKSPSTNDDGRFVGVTESSAIGNEGLFLNSRHKHYTGCYEGLVPLLVCSDCGMSFCDGIWTRIGFSSERVTWSGLGIPSDELGFRQIDDPQIFFFDRKLYEEAFADAKIRTKQDTPPNP